MTTELHSKITNLPHITIGDDTYLSFESVLRTVANELYPNAEGTDFAKVLAVSTATLSQLCYAPAEKVYPPAVPFPGGDYCRKFPALSPEIVAAALNQLATAYNIPELRVQRAVLMLNIYKRSGLAGDVPQPIRESYTEQMILIAQEQGWSISADRKIIFKPLPFNAQKARTEVRRKIEEEGGRPIYEDSLVQTAVYRGY